MRHIYAPFIGRVVECARTRLDGGSPGDLPKAIEAALAELGRIRSVYDDLQPSVLRGSESIVRALRDVEECFDLLRKALEAIGEAGRAGVSTPSVDGSETREPLLAGALDALEGAAAELWRALDVLSSIQAGEASYSPFPTVNLCIKVGMNVLDGHLGAESLDPWMHRLDAVVAGLQGRIQRFESLHPDRPPELSAAVASLAGDVAAGAGAVRTFRTLGDRTALLDALRLLRHGTESLAAALEEMDRFVRQSARWSTMPVVEDFCRAVAGNAEASVVDDAVDSLEHFLRFLNAQLEALRALPLSYTIADPTTGLASALEEARRAIDATRENPTELSLGTLGDALALARNRRDDALAALEREMDAVALSPHLEELKELAGRFLQGAISESFLRERVIAWLKAHAMLEMQLRDTARAALGSDAAELLSLLHEQGEGIEEATLFFRDGNPSHLVVGFHKMEAPLAGLADIRERVLRSLRPAGGAPTMMNCFGCGAPNAPGRTYCHACGRLLPKIAKAVAPAAGPDEASPPLPRNIERLERIVHAYEQQRASAADIQYEVGLFLGRLGHIRRDFERRYIPRLRAERSPSMINMGREFYENLTSLQQGLYDMLAFGDHLRPDGLYRGLQECVEAGRAMRTSQQRIEEVLGEL